MADPTIQPVAVQPIELRYADAPARDGLVLETSEHGVRITLPTIRFNATHFASTLFIIVISIAIPVLRWGHGFVMFLVQNPLVVMPSILIFAVSFWAVPKMMRKAEMPRTIEVTAESLVLTNILVEEEQTIITRPRGEVYDIRYVAHSGNLVIHCHKMNMVECRPVRDPIVLKWIAAVLRDAMALPDGSQVGESP
jgi:hypothetical protein